jgi:hypothetical protein
MIAKREEVIGRTASNIDARRAAPVARAEAAATVGICGVPPANAAEN